MIKSFDFFFDFISPYSYLAHEQIKNIELQNNIKINYIPVLLGGLLKMSETKANFFVPSKAKFMIRDCKLIADKLNIKFKFNSHFPMQTLNLMRGVLIAEKEKKKYIYIDNFFNAYWKDGANLNDQKIINKILLNLNINIDNFQIELNKQNVKDILKENTVNSFKKGIFGTPSFIINNKVFWGQDRLEFVLNEARKN